MSDDEPRFTLREASQELQRQECAQRGHSWSVVEVFGEGPVRITCPCGASYPVGRELL